MSNMRTDFLIKRDDLRSTCWNEAPAEAIEPGQARLRIDRFALTSNNITYGAFGDRLGYWDFFPAPEGFGRLPVWGFAEVVESQADGLKPGERIFGCFPISDELVVTVSDLSAAGFSDAAPWRIDFASVYNRYARIGADPALASAASKAIYAVFQPLFGTAFLIDLFFAENDYCGATQILISSASSKTSLALGKLLSERARPGLEIIGLTSPANIDFCRRTGCFDRVTDYAAIPDIDQAPTLFIDMAGSNSVRTAIHQHFGDALQYSCAVGWTHWQDPGQADGLPGPRPKVFSAPKHIDQKIADWGLESYQARFADAWKPFARSAEGLLDIVEHRGCNAIATLYHTVLEGKLPAHTAAVASVGE